MSEKNAFHFVNKLTEKPAPWSKYTAADLWTDEHISKQMLDFHLDPESEPASRPHRFINDSADWIAKRFNLKSSSSVVDLGCGPGLYTSRFYESGARVTGVDFSPRSIEYARQQADRENRSINYIQGNYLEIELPETFDLATMIYCDYCALSPAQRKQLLHRIRKLLHAKGSFLFDVCSITAFQARSESSEIARNLMDGFWSAEENVGIRQTWKYVSEKVILDRYDIYEQERNRTIYNWLQYFDMNSLQNELELNGFYIIDSYSDMTGTAFSEDSMTFAIVVEKGV